MDYTMYLFISDYGERFINLKNINRQIKFLSYIEMLQNLMWVFHGLNFNSPKSMS